MHSEGDISYLDLGRWPMAAFFFVVWTMTGVRKHEE
jgi:hypothetical protein